jgi:hypothetical protein
LMNEDKLREHAMRCLEFVPGVGLGMAYNIYMYTLRCKWDKEFGRKMCSFLSTGTEKGLNLHFDNDRYQWKRK